MAFWPIFFYLAACWLIVFCLRVDGGWFPMAKKIVPLLPATEALLGRFGDRLRVARLRRRLRSKQVAEAAGMSPMTLRSLERGGSGVTIGAYLAVMQVLGIEEDLNLLARDESAPEGRTGAGAGEQPLVTSKPKVHEAAEAVAQTPRVAELEPGTAENDGGVERIRRVIEAIPEERWRMLCDWLGHMADVAGTPGGSPPPAGERRPDRDFSPSAGPSLQATFDWLDAPASDLRKLVKPAPAVVRAEGRRGPQDSIGEPSRDSEQATLPG